MFVLVGVSARALLESAVASGYQAMAIDYFADQDCRWRGEAFRLDELGFAAAAGNLLPAAAKVVLSRPDWRQHYQGLVYAAGPENWPDGLPWWEKTGLLWGNSATTLQQVRNLQECSAVLPAGCFLPPFYTPAAWRRQSGKGVRWLVKPVNSGGGRGIRWLADNSRLAEAQVTALSNKKNPYIIQQFIPGIPASVTFIADGEQAVIMGTSRQLLPQAGRYPVRFDYAGSIVPLDLPAGQVAALTGPLDQVVNRLTRTGRLKGINTLDFIVNQQGIWLLEVNPRWSASAELIERWRGERLFARHLAAVAADSKWAAGISLSSACQSAGYWGKKIIYARKTITVQATDAALRHYYRQGLRDIPLPGTCITGGQPLCTVLAWGKTGAACRRQLLLKAAWAEAALADCPVPACR